MRWTSQLSSYPQFLPRNRKHLHLTKLAHLVYEQVRHHFYTCFHISLTSCLLFVLSLKELRKIQGLDHKPSPWLWRNIRNKFKLSVWDLIKKYLIWLCSGPARCSPGCDSVPWAWCYTPDWPGLLLQQHVRTLEKSGQVCDAIPKTSEIHRKMEPKFHESCPLHTSVQKSYCRQLKCSSSYTANVPRMWRSSSKCSKKMKKPVKKILTE